MTTPSEKEPNALSYSNGTFTLELKSYDHGGRMRIQVGHKPGTVKYPTYWSHVAEGIKDDPRNPKENWVWLPVDYDSDRLPDKWERDITDPDNLTTYAYDTDDDDDPHTPSSNTGDGFYAFHEYRGLMHKGQFTRLDPKKKEVFVSTSIGYGHLASATGYTVYEVTTDNDTEMANSNLMTANAYMSPDDEYSGGLCMQKGIRIRELGGTDPNDPNALGVCVWGTPNDLNENTCVRIYKDVIHSYAQQHGWSEEVLRARVITHECGHDLKLAPSALGQHHHDPNTNACIMDRTISADNLALQVLCDGCRSSMFLH